MIFCIAYLEIVFVMQVSFGEMIGCDKEDVSIQYTIIR